MPGFKEYCLTSETIQKIDRLPEHLVVVGAGFIGLELAQLFSMLGSKVTLVNADARLLPNEDEQVANILCKAFAAAGITVLNNAKAKEVTQDHKVLLEDGAEVQGTAVLLAIGRKPNTESIDTQKSAIDLCPKGFVKVDERLISSNPGVYAIGDVNGGPQFTSVSYDDHKVVFNQLIGKRSKTTKSRLVPFTLFTSPEVARVGLTEAQAKDLSMEYESLEMPLDGLPSGLIHDYGAGLLKVLICKKSKKLIGCSLVTAEAAHMIGIAQTAIVAGLPFNALRDLILTHPTISEAFNFLLAQSSLEDQSFEDVAVTWRIKLRGLANCFANPEP